MLLHVLAIVGGLLVLAVASDVFVVGAARVASIAGLPQVVVGTLVIGFGTGLPELLTSVLAASQRSLGVAAGSIIGSNTVNATLVMGCAALVAAPAVSSRVLRREAPVALAGVMLFAALALTALSRADGVVLVIAFALATTVLSRRALGGGRHAGDEARPRGEDAPDGEAELYRQLEEEHAGHGGGAGARHEGSAGAVQRGLAVEIARSVVGLAATLGGAQLLVWGALGVAESTGVNQGVIGFTVVALGTSLPELVSAIQASRRGHTGLVIGNVLGSNLFNALLVGGVAALVHPGPVPSNVAHFPNLIMVATMVALTIWMFTGRRLRRLEGAAMVCTYALAVALSIV